MHPRSKASDRGTRCSLAVSLPRSQKRDLGHPDPSADGFVHFEDAFVAAVDYFAHGGEVVYAEDGHYFEFAVGGLVHLAVFPDDHGGYGFRALDVGDVEALDAAGEFGEHEGVGEGFLNGFAGGLEDAEALDVGLLGVLPGEVDRDRFSPRWGTAISMRWPVRSVRSAARDSRSSKSTGTRMERGT